MGYKHLQRKEIEDLKLENKKIGTELTLRELQSEEEFSFKFVTAFEFDSLSNFLAFSVIDTSNMENGLYIFDLESKNRYPFTPWNQDFIPTLLGLQKLESSFYSCFL